MICKVNKTGLITHNVSVTSTGEDINLTNNNASIFINATQLINNETKYNSTVNNTAGDYNKTIENVIISVKKVTKVKKSSRVTKIGITLKGSKTINKLKIKFKANKNVKIKLNKSLKGKKVTIKIKNKSYKVKINKKGFALLKSNKNLKKGKYYISRISWKGFKVYKNKKLTVNFNGKTYKVKTNKFSVATFKVTKKMVINLKKGKSYKYTIKYQNNKINRFVKIK